MPAAREKHRRAFVVRDWIRCGCVRLVLRQTWLRRIGNLRANSARLLRRRISTAIMRLVKLANYGIGHA